VPVAGFASRSAASARTAARATGPSVRVFRSPRELAESSRLIVVAVPDRAIEDVARALAPHLRRGTVVAHVSGAVSSSALAACRAAGAAVASFHPLQTFPGHGPALVAGAHVAIEGDRVAVAVLRRLAIRLRMRPFTLRARRRPLYHAAAALASNAVVALFALAVAEFARATGRSRRAAERALAPLLEATARNIVAEGSARALSGPIARGDEATVARHLEALSGDREASAVYRWLSLRAVEVALEKGTIDRRTAARLRRRLGGSTARRRLR